MSRPLPGTDGRRRIYLMRHGDVDYYQRDGRRVDEPDLVPLTDEGRRQAGLMAELLAEVPFDRALHTGLPRTVETATLVLAGRAVPLAKAGPFREIRLGRVDDLPEHRIHDEYVYGFENAALPGARFARGEPFAEFHARVVDALVELLATPGWTRLLLVAHGGTNRSILSWASHGGLRGMATFEQDTGCLNVLDADLIDGAIVRRYIRLLNMTPYNLTKHGNYLTNVEQTFAKRGKR